MLIQEQALETEATKTCSASAEETVEAMDAIEATSGESCLFLNGAGVTVVYWVVLTVVVCGSTLVTRTRVVLDQYQQDVTPACRVSYMYSVVVSMTVAAGRSMNELQKGVATGALSRTESQSSE